MLGSDGDNFIIEIVDRELEETRIVYLESVSELSRITMFLANKPELQERFMIANVTPFPPVETLQEFTNEFNKELPDLHMG